MLQSPVVKAVLVGAIVLLLLIPLAMVRGLIDERSGTRSAAEAEVSAKWGGPQNLGGPILVVPYVVRIRDEKGRVELETEYAILLPRGLAIDGEMTPEIRYRGIYPVPLYSARLTVRGEFNSEDLAALRIPEPDVRWQDAVLSMSVPDLRGLRQSVRLAWAGSAIDFEPGAGAGSFFPSGIHARVGGHLSSNLGSPAPFEFELGLHGSGQLTFLPLGRETRAALASPWPSPSFMGSFLPDTRTVTAGGFTAEWRLFYLGRSYPQAWRAGEVDPNVVMSAAGGVSLHQTVDQYQKSTRSAKYGILFLALTFGVYFLLEVLSRLRVHPFQYLLVGFALVLFYVLLLSLSEHLGFDPAYVLAAAATIGLISGYSAFVLRGRRHAAGIGMLLSGLYGYLYVLLQLEDYALLLGAFGLFLALGAVMWITRRVDWYALSEWRRSESS
jgi:inner membrane protein